MAKWDDRQRPKPGPERDRAIVAALGSELVDGGAPPPYSTDEKAMNELVATVERALELRLKAELIEGRVWTAAFLPIGHDGPFPRVPGRSRVDAVSAAALLALLDAKS